MVFHKKTKLELPRERQLDLFEHHPDFSIWIDDEGEPAATHRGSDVQKHSDVMQS